MIADIEKFLEAAKECEDERRKALVTSIAKGRKAEDLDGWVNQLASVEGEIVVASRALTAAKNAKEGEEKKAAREAILGLLLDGANDTWSGRSNDAHRSKFDGLRKASKTLLQLSK